MRSSCETSVVGCSLLSSLTHHSSNSPLSARADFYVEACPSENVRRENYIRDLVLQQRHVSISSSDCTQTETACPTPCVRNRPYKTPAFHKTVGLGVGKDFTIRGSRYNTDITKINIAIYCRMGFLAQPYKTSNGSIMQ